MRLLKATDQQGELMLEEFFGSSMPIYAIFSHTWAEEEVLFADVQNKSYAMKKGYSKIRFALEQAQADGYSWLWVDTCCIDKSSSAELSESINSMYAWYQRAAACYAYLADVEAQPDPADEKFDRDRFLKQFGASRWWKRGWTLQELLAPRRLQFYSRLWRPLGDKSSLKEQIAGITQVDADILSGSAALNTASIAKRMSWAASRTTTREEDIAYCLMGVFDVNMPLLYGEGHKAFIRLQEEIMRKSDDHSLFAWRIAKDSTYRPLASHGLLADSPKGFATTGTASPYRDWEDRRPYSMTNRGLGIDLQLVDTNFPGTYMAALQCPSLDGSRGELAIILKKIAGSRDEYTRIHCDTLKVVAQPSKAQLIYVRQLALTPDTNLPYSGYMLRLRHMVVNVTRFNLMDCISSCLPFRGDILPQEYTIGTETQKLITAFLLNESVKYSRQGRYVAISIGSTSVHQIGFDVCELLWNVARGVGSFQRQDYQAMFSPQEPGTWMELPTRRIKIEAEDVVEMGRKVYLIDVVLEKSNDPKTQPLKNQFKDPVTKARPVENALNEQTMRVVTP